VRNPGEVCDKETDHIFTPYFLLRDRYYRSHKPEAIQKLATGKLLKKKQQSKTNKKIELLSRQRNKELKSF
jgi:hypothetical protein